MQVPQSGLAVVPPRTGRMLPQPAQRARRFWQAVHHGSPVISEISAGARRAQIEQVIVFAGRQAGHSGPPGVRTLTAAPGAADTRFQVGGVGDQAVGTQRPSVLIAGGRLPDDPAARACDGAGLGHAVAAEPHPVARFDQGDDTPAVRAGGADDPLRPGVGELRRSAAGPRGPALARRLR